MDASGLVGISPLWTVEEISQPDFYMKMTGGLQEVDIKGFIVETDDVNTFGFPEGKPVVMWPGQAGDPCKKLGLYCPTK